MASPSTSHSAPAAASPARRQAVLASPATTTKAGAKAIVPSSGASDGQRPAQAGPRQEQRDGGGAHGHDAAPLPGGRPRARRTRGRARAADRSHPTRGSSAMASAATAAAVRPEIGGSGPSSSSSPSTSAPPARPAPARSPNRSCRRCAPRGREPRPRPSDGRPTRRSVAGSTSPPTSSAAARRRPAPRAAQPDAASARGRVQGVVDARTDRRGRSALSGGRAREPAAQHAGGGGRAPAPDRVRAGPGLVEGQRQRVDVARAATRGRPPPARATCRPGCRPGRRCG